ncbi:MAG: glycosyltransferase [FCB group bacterium]|nr:glycosyltransferase [FCB group bacterium]
MAAPKTSVIYITDSLGRGGAEKQLYYLCSNLPRDKYSVGIISLNDVPSKTYSNRLTKLGIPIWQLTPEDSGLSNRLRAITRILKAKKPDIIHSWSFYANPYASVCGFLAGIPVRLGSLRNNPFSVAIRAMNPLLRWLAYHSVNGFVVNSRIARDQLIENGYPTEKIFYVRNALEIDDTAHLQTEPADLSGFGIDPYTKVVATVGNIRSQKNHKLFVEAMQNVLQTVPDVKCLIVGVNIPREEALFRSLQQQIAGLGLEDSIHFTGQRDDIPQLLRRITVFCLTSLSEGTPNVVLEAMAAGVPVVSTNVGDVPEIITDGENGLLVDSGDAAGLSRKVTALLEDENLATKLGEAGKRTIHEKYSVSRSVGEMETVYANYLNGKKQK